MPAFIDDVFTGHSVWLWKEGRCMQSLCPKWLRGWRRGRQEIVTVQVTRALEGSARVAARGCGREPWGSPIQQWFDTHWRILQDPREAISAAFKDKLFHWGRIFKYILDSQNIPLHFCSWCTWPRTSVRPPWALWHTLAIVLPGASFTAFRFSCHCHMEAPLLPFWFPLIHPSQPPSLLYCCLLLTAYSLMHCHCLHPSLWCKLFGDYFFFFVSFPSVSSVSRAVSSI